MLKDKLGNELKTGQYVSVTVLDHNIVCKVMDIQTLKGELILVSEHHIPFDPRGAILPAIVVCQTPPQIARKPD